MPLIVRALAGLFLSLFLVAPAMSEQILLNIRPTSGVGPLSLGMAMEDVRKQLGQPDEELSDGKVLGAIADPSKSFYSLVRFDTEWGYTGSGAPFYKVLFNKGKLVFILSTYKRMGSFKLAKKGRALPPLTKAMVEDVFGAPSEVKRYGKFKHMIYLSADGSGMGFAHAGPGEDPVGMLMFAGPSSQAQTNVAQASTSPTPASPALQPAPALQPCLARGETVEDARAYVERFYRCDSLADVGDLALSDELARLWKSAVDSGLIDQPFTIMGNDYEITGLSVVEHALDAYNPRSIEQTIRVTFRNFGEQQTIDWVFQDDLSDREPMTLVDIRGVSPAAYGLLDSLRSVLPHLSAAAVTAPQTAGVPIPSPRPQGAPASMEAVPVVTGQPVTGQQVTAPSVTPPSSAGPAGPDVTRQYMALMKSGIAPDLRYAIRLDAGRWLTTSPDWETPMPVTVDAAKGTILILDEGTGGGSFETQVALWPGSGGTPLLGIAETAMIQPGQESSRVRFFEPIAGKWTEQTGYVWPDISLADFMPGEMTIADLRDLKAIGSSVQVRFPQGGKDAEASLMVPQETVQAVCEGEDWFVPADKGPYLRYCERIAEGLFRSLLLKWSSDKGRFQKGTPIKRVQKPKICDQTGTLIQEKEGAKQAATIFEFDCGGTKTLIYQYRDTSSFRVLQPPNWARPIGDFKTYSEALAAAVAAGGG
ncbi:MULTISPECIES: hypothetical protein [unclassified Roseibium]|uniref:hypothetical protein n=1 Tax=unclassified Roseibium TaxID=2629323 RepID=UPI00273D1974|nr:MULTISPECIES: hypothetical protein [unclassified Roseibium]